MQRGLPVLLVLIATSGACATWRELEGPQEPIPAAAPTPSVLRFLSPRLRDEVFPPEPVFGPRAFLDRLVCPYGDRPAWELGTRSGLVYTYKVTCPGLAQLDVTFDTASELIPPASPLRLLSAAGFEAFHDAELVAQKGDRRAALRGYDEAIALSPDEPVYRRERVATLYLLGRVAEAAVESEDLVSRFPSPVAYRYRALVMREIGFDEAYEDSLDGILRTCGEGHPLYAEAVCAKGMFVVTKDADEGERLMRQGCSLSHQPCCDALTQRARAAERMKAATDAIRSLRMRVEAKQGEVPAEATKQLVTPQRTDDASDDKKGDASQKR